MIKIETQNDKLVTTTPYHPDFPSRARKLGGKWHASSKTWTFDVRDEFRVKELCRSIFGEDGTNEAPINVVTLRVEVGHQWESEYRESLWLGGRMVARATSRDSGARLGDGIVLLDGSVRSGGSAKYWLTIAEEGSIFEIRDVPKEKAEEEIKNASSSLKIKILDDNSNLQEEAESIKEQIRKLESRLIEIETELKNNK